MSKYAYLLKRRDKAMNVFRQAQKDLILVCQQYDAEIELARKRKADAQNAVDQAQADIETLFGGRVSTADQAAKIEALF